MSAAVGNAETRHYFIDDQHRPVARGELAQRKADRDVVAKDEARFREKALRAADAREAEAAEEVFRGSAGRK